MRSKDFGFKGLSVMALILAQVVCAAETTQTKSTEKITSVYTSLSTKVGCKLEKEIRTDGDTGSVYGSVANCPGIGGFKLKVFDEDLRQTIDVVTPSNKNYALNYWEVVMRGWSGIGEKAEWRVRKRDGKLIPVALIVRVEGPKQVDNEPIPQKSFLAVAKITPTEICVTDSIPGSPTANEDARRAADASAQKPCLRAK